MRLSRIVLDTSAYSWLRSGHREVRRRVAEAQLVYLPAVVLGELAAGFVLGRRRKENETALGAFLERPFVETLDVTPAVAVRYGVLFAALRRAGTPIPVNDIWIAATTLAAGAHLLTFDQDFSYIAELPHTILSTGE
jgi:tRNA(fMet)-specific endonuclease VapC